LKHKRNSRRLGCRFEQHWVTEQQLRDGTLEGEPNGKIPGHDGVDRAEGLILDIGGFSLSLDGDLLSEGFNVLSKVVNEAC